MTVSQPSQVIQPSIPDCGQNNEHSAPVLSGPLQTFIPTVSDFNDHRYPHRRAKYEPTVFEEERRFHISFAYLNGNHGVALGEQVVRANDLNQAAIRIARERGVFTLFLRKRFFSNRPASEAEILNFVVEVADHSVSGDRS